MALTIDDILTRAGHHMWRELPEEYRYRDLPPVAGEPSDLAAYLHGLGHLLDLIRGTTEQLYADSFAEVVDDRSGGRQIQSWLLPYLGDLIGADLVAPDPPPPAPALPSSATANPIRPPAPPIPPLRARFWASWVPATMPCHPATPRNFPPSPFTKAIIWPKRARACPTPR